MLKFIILFVFTTLPLLSQANFNDFFIDKTLRIDFYHTGDSKNDIISLGKIYKYGIWAGSKKNLTDRFNNGIYYIKVYDAGSRKLLFSRGFDDYFREYQTSENAIKGVIKTYQESAIIPCPKKNIRFAVEKRDSLNKLKEIFSVIINPDDVNIISKEPYDKTVMIYRPVENGDPHNKVDIAVIGEGYTIDQKNKFENDLGRFTETFFSQEPYKSMKERFNIYGVLKPSSESGVDEPRAGIFRNTALSATFNSLGSERYLLTEDNSTLRNIASFVPYDALFIMVNSARYGGGGIYNFYCTFTSDNQWFGYLLLHEFGHSFAGLGDEYYTSSTSYNDFYPAGIEPTEPNITALADKTNVKWKDLLTPGIEIPSPWEKAKFDKFDSQWQERRRNMNNKITELKKSHAPINEIKKAVKEYDNEDKAHSMAVDKFLANSKYAGMTGAFEGAGYASEGLYRPMVDCIMFSKGKKTYCSVCRRAVEKMIMFYSE